MNWNPNQPAFDRIIAALLTEVDQAYVVGGAVRDFLWDQKTRITDLDIVIDERANPIARRIADRVGWAFYPMGAAHDVARLVFARGQGVDLTCDFAGMRGITIENDLAARDFTVNAMAVELTRVAEKKVVDPFGGRQDLEARMLRRVSPVSLLEDPVRLLRAVRMMVQFEFTIDAATRAQVERLTDTIRLSSAERARDEMWRMLASRHPRRALQLLDEFGLLRFVLPEVSAIQGVAQSEPHYQDVYSHTLATVELAGALRDWLLHDLRPIGPPSLQQILDVLADYKYPLRRHFGQYISGGRTRAEWLVWHALFHDAGKATTASTEGGTMATEGGSARIRFLGHEEVSAELATNRLSALRFGNNEVALCAAVVRSHMRPHSLHSSFLNGKISRRAAYRYFRDVGGRQFGRGLGIDTLILAMADFAATYREMPDIWTAYAAHAKQLLDDYFETSDGESSEVSPLINGHELIRILGIEQGKLVGDLLDQIMEAQAAGEVSTVHEAIELARRLENESG